MGHVFISYSRHDAKEYAIKLGAELEKSGISVWIDSHLFVGDNFDDVIKAQIYHCSAFIIIMTPKGEISRYIQKTELPYAREFKKPIFPLLFSGDCWALHEIEKTHYEEVRQGQLPSTRFFVSLAMAIQAQGVEFYHNRGNFTETLIHTMSKAQKDILAVGVILQIVEGHLDYNWVGSVLNRKQRKFLLYFSPLKLGTLKVFIPKIKFIGGKQKEQCCIRLLFLSPYEIENKKIKEKDGKPVKNPVVKVMDTLTGFGPNQNIIFFQLRRLMKWREKLGEDKGCLEIRCYDNIPTAAFIIDGKMKHKDSMIRVEAMLPVAGDARPSFDVKPAAGELYDQLLGVYENLWDSAVSGEDILEARDVQVNSER